MHVQDYSVDSWTVSELTRVYLSNTDHAKDPTCKSAIEALRTTDVYHLPFA